MPNCRQYEKDESHRLRKLVDQMNKDHAEMGGRDSRPERKALVRCMQILQTVIDQLKESAHDPHP
jgi:hypothetical protein